MSLRLVPKEQVWSLGFAWSHPHFNLLFLFLFSSFEQACKEHAGLSRIESWIRRYENAPVESVNRVVFVYSTNSHPHTSTYHSVIQTFYQVLIFVFIFLLQHAMPVCYMVSVSLPSHSHPSMNGKEKKYRQDNAPAAQVRKKIML